MDKKQILALMGMVLLIAAIAGTVYLVQRQQRLKSKASGSNFVNAFELRDNNGNLINCDTSTTPPTCTTSTLDIKVKVKPENLNLLLP